MTVRTMPPAYLVYLIFIATLGPFQFGYHLGELNTPQKVITCQGDSLPLDGDYGILSLPPCIPMGASWWGLVQSIFTLGGLFGALASGPLATKYGRLFTMRLVTLALFLGPVVTAFAPDISVMTIGRWISGVGAGGATVVCPIYVAEVSPPAQRGLFGAFTQVMINFGILVAQLLGYFLSRNSLWRIIFVAVGLIAVLTFAGLVFCPETPKWLAKNHRPHMARRILRQIRGHDADIRAEMQDWDLSGEQEEESLLRPPPSEPRPHKESGASFFDVVRIRKYRLAVIGVAATMMAQQLCGINSVVMYSVAILEEIMPSAAALVTVMVSAINVLVTLACAPLADKIGRKPCLLLSIAGMGINTIFLAVGLSQDRSSLTVIGLLLFVCSFGLGLGPVPFVLASELVGPEAVGATSSWALACNWLSTFCVAQFFPMLNAALPRGQVYWLFTAVALVFGAFIAWWIPESKGRANADEVWSRGRGSQA